MPNERRPSSGTGIAFSPSPLWFDFHLILGITIRSHAADIDSIIITLDSHRYGHIANQSFWQDCDGKEPDVFSVITYGDITSGKWRPKDLSQLVSVRYRFA